MQSTSSNQNYAIKDVSDQINQALKKNNHVHLSSSLGKDFAHSDSNSLNKTWGPSKTEINIKLDSRPNNVSLMSKLSNWTTNLYYSISNSSYISNEGQTLIILGKQVDYSQQAEIPKIISQIIWFSYREKIPPIMKEKFQKGAYACDRGWGCMLRCGQMMVAEAIKRHMKYKEAIPEIILSEDKILEILGLFADSIQDGEISPFSIQQICAKAYEYFELKPGEWYKPSTIMVTLSKLNEQYNHLLLQNMKMCIFLDGTIFEDQIFEKAFNKNYQKDQENEQKSPYKIKKNEEEKEDNENDNQNLSDNCANKETSNLSLLEKEWDNSILIFIATKTGLDEHNELYLNTIFKLLSLKQSIGMLGGRGSKAYYFIGFQNKKFLYFDPHYVQDAPQSLESLSSIYKTYFLNKCFQINMKDIDTSVGFGFYIKNEKDYLDFKLNLHKAIEEDPNFLVGFELQTPTMEINPEDVVEYSSDHSFEIIE